MEPFRPIVFSARYGLAPSELDRLGVFDPVLNADTLLFPDPMLLRDSSHSEMREAAEVLDEHFETVRRLIAGSRGLPTGPAKKAALRKLRFPEIPGTCLGYGSNSIHGSGAGTKTAERMLQTAEQIITLGIDDPDLFLAMGLFEKDFGPDLIGDMVTNVCFGKIIEFNARVSKELRLPTQQFDFKLANGSTYVGRFARNDAYEDEEIPVILLPKDILRDLPVAVDWRGVQESSEKNEEFRSSLNSSVSALWSRKTLESKDKLKQWALSSRSAFGDLLDIVHGLDAKPYDFDNDRLGELIWRDIATGIVEKYPVNIEKPEAENKKELQRVVDEIIEQFRYLIEDRDLWKEFYTEFGEPRIEKAAQRFLYMIALSYCEANNIDVTPEADTGRGPVDFKFSKGSDLRLLVEIKLSRNPKLVQGLERQIALYQKGEKSFDSRYVIIDIGGIGMKWKRIEKIEEAARKARKPMPKVIYINAKPKPSASKA